MVSRLLMGVLVAMTTASAVTTLPWLVSSLIGVSLSTLVTWALLKTRPPPARMALTRPDTYFNG